MPFNIQHSIFYIRSYRRILYRLTQNSMLPSRHLLYVLVLSGSLFGICVLFGGRALLRTRAVRRFVRSVKQRFQFAEERGASFVEEKKIIRPRKNPRASAIELQQVRSLAEKALGINKIEEAER